MTEDTPGRELLPLPTTDAAVRLLAEPIEPSELRHAARRLRDELVDALLTTTSRLSAIREERLAAAGRDAVTISDLRDEWSHLADAGDFLRQVAWAFGEAAKEADGLAADRLEVLAAPQMSARVADAWGQDVIVKLVKPTAKTSVVVSEVVDVLVAAGPKDAAVEELKAFRAGAEAVLALFGSGGWRSTALDSLVGDLQASGRPELAARLQAAYGKVAGGEPRPKIERAEARQARGGTR